MDGERRFPIGLVASSLVFVGILLMGLGISSHDASSPFSPLGWTGVGLAGLGVLGWSVGIIASVQRWFARRRLRRERLA